MASCGLGPPFDRWCLDLEELDDEPELLELPLKSFDILLIFGLFSPCVNSRNEIKANAINSEKVFFLNSLDFAGGYRITDFPARRLYAEIGRAHV